MGCLSRTIGDVNLVILLYGLLEHVYDLLLMTLDVLYEKRKVTCYNLII